MTEPPARAEMIRQRLAQALSPASLEVVDESPAHAGHAKAGGGGHFRVNIVAAAFEGKNAVQRHRMVYGALTDLFPEHIHALSVQAHAPSEQ